MNSTTTMRAATKTKRAALPRKARPATDWTARGASLFVITFVLVGVALRCAPAPSGARTTLPASSHQSRIASSPPASTTAPSVAATDPEACEPLHVELPELMVTDIDVAVPPIEDLSHKEMTSFYEKAARLLRGRADGHVRMVVYGDSNLTRDFITGELRRALQLRYGDAGHGFIALAKPWNWYLHMDVRHNFDKQAWRAIAMSTHQVEDRLYGFGGIAAQSIAPNARTWVATAADDAPIGRAMSHAEVYYLRHPGFGSFSIEVDGTRVKTVETGAAEVSAGYEAIDMADGPHRIDFVAGAKPVRLLGVALERSRPGFVVDAVGIGGVNAQTLAKGDRALAIDTLRHRSYDLVMFLTGATEPALPSTDTAMQELVARHREALPGASILLMSPPDLAGGPGKQPTLNPRIGQLARQKRDVAAATGAAFWDFRAAMGGEMSVVRFKERGMAWDDYIHLTGKGGAYMGRRLAYALLQGLDTYVTEHPDAGCRPPAPARE